LKDAAGLSSHMYIQKLVNAKPINKYCFKTLQIQPDRKIKRREYRATRQRRKRGEYRATRQEEKER
jgi:hypothetical protein